MEQPVPGTTAGSLPQACPVCQGPLWPDKQFNFDMQTHNINKVRYACMHDHGIIIELPREVAAAAPRLCRECLEPLPPEVAKKQLFHRDCYKVYVRKMETSTKKRRFKSGSYV